jgi:cell division protein FtsA
MEEIIDLVHYEILNSGYSKKLIGGIVVTGGGAQMKHMTQLFEYITGMDTRIGYPTEHLANNNHIENLTSPMYATGIGLVLKGFEALEKNGKMVEPASSGSVKTHSEKKAGTFFETIMKKGMNWFAEEDGEK